MGYSLARSRLLSACPALAAPVAHRSALTPPVERRSMLPSRAGIKTPLATYRLTASIASKVTPGRSTHPRSFNNARKHGRAQGGRKSVSLPIGGGPQASGVVAVGDGQAGEMKGGLLAPLPVCGGPRGGQPRVGRGGVAVPALPLAPEGPRTALSRLRRTHAASFLDGHTACRRRRRLTPRHPRDVINSTVFKSIQRPAGAIGEVH